MGRSGGALGTDPFTDPDDRTADRHDREEWSPPDHGTDERQDRDGKEGDQLAEQDEAADPTRDPGRTATRRRGARCAVRRDRRGVVCRATGRDRSRRRPSPGDRRIRPASNMVGHDGGRGGHIGSLDEDLGTHRATRAHGIRAGRRGLERGLREGTASGEHPHRLREAVHRPCRGEMVAPTDPVLDEIGSPDRHNDKEDESVGRHAPKLRCGVGKAADVGRCVVNVTGVVGDPADPAASHRSAPRPSRRTTRGRARRRRCAASACGPPPGAGPACGPPRGSRRSRAGC